jgi:16S rRNA (cytosine967-C5)-methyltransferase
MRERVALGEDLERDPVPRTAHPRWLVDAIARDWPGQSDTILAANNEQAPLTLRVNRRRGDRDSLRESFSAAGIEGEPHPQLPDALILPHGGEISRLPGYAEGLFSVQDGAAQRVADLIAPTPGQRVLDACAAPGGKAAHLLERADIDLLAIDRDPARLPRLRENLERLGLDARIRAADATRPDEWWDGRAFDRILLDAPCSASGILRRQPDVRLHRRAADIPALAAVQEELLNSLWPLLAPGGRLVYATCSVLRAENEASVAGLLAARHDALALDVPDTFGHVAGVGRQRLPGEDGMDGFFYALLEKTR